MSKIKLEAVATSVGDIGVLLSPDGKLTVDFAKHPMHGVDYTYFKDIKEVEEKKITPEGIRLNKAYVILQAIADNLFIHDASIHPN